MKSICFNTMTGKLIIFTLLFCAYNLITVNGLLSSEIVDRIVAVVNDDIITLFELNRLVKPYEKKIYSLGYPAEKERMMLFKVRENLLNQLIDEKIETQEIKRSKISISEEKIDQTIEKIKEKNFLTDEDLRSALAKDGVTMEEYRKKIKDQILRTRLVDREVKSKIVITKEDIKAYYEKHLDKYAGEEKYHLRNIIMKVPLFATEDEKLKIKKKMDDILEKLKAGASFETMAKQYSESSAAAEGGDLGVFEFDTLSPQLQEAIKGMKPGEFTPVLHTDQGYQIFFLENILKTPTKSVEEVSPQIVEIIFKERSNKKYQKWIEGLRQQSVIKIIQ